MVLNGVLDRPSFGLETVALSTYQTMPFIVKVMLAVDVAGPVLPEPVLLDAV